MFLPLSSFACRGGCLCPEAIVQEGGYTRTGHQSAAGQHRANNHTHILIPKDEFRETNSPTHHALKNRKKVSRKYENKNMKHRH